MDRFSAWNPLIAPESWPTRARISAVTFVTPPLRVGFVRAEAIGGDRCEELTTSASGGGKVWTATDITRGGRFSLCDGIREDTLAASSSLHDYSVHELLVPRCNCVLLLYSGS